MAQTLQVAHLVLSILLIAVYGFLATWLFRQKGEEISPMVVTLSQLARLTLLLTYMSGLVLTMNFGRKAATWHHYASLTPIIVIFFFQFLPQAIQKPLSPKGYALMFFAMLLTIVLIALSNRIFV
jgi:hypothetical protein